MTAPVSVRKRYASSCHIVSGLEEAAEAIEPVLNQVEYKKQEKKGYCEVTKWALAW